MRRLVLVGGGHAHLEVLRRAARRPLADTELLLVTPFAEHVYSSVMPAQLREDAAGSRVAFDLRALCRAAGARLLEAPAERVEGGARPVVHAAGGRLECDVLSLDVGAEPSGLDTPGARAHALTVRPLGRWRAMLARLDGLAAAPPRAPAASHVVVVGGGAAGVELSLAAARRLGVGRGAATVTLVERGETILPELPRAVAARVERALAAAGVRRRLGHAVARVEADGVALADGTCLPSDATIWVTGAAAPPVVAGSSLPRDERGFLLVDDTLRSVDGAAVWGAGDCVALRGAPWMAKSGVYAVREAPVLAANLRAAVAGRPPTRRFAPERTYLTILDTSDGRAVLHWRGHAVHARWALWLKRAIDGRFQARYPSRAAARGS